MQARSRPAAVHALDAVDLGAVASRNACTHKRTNAQIERVRAGASSPPSKDSGLTDDLRHVSIESLTVRSKVSEWFARSSTGPRTARLANSHFMRLCFCA